MFDVMQSTGAGGGVHSSPGSGSRARDLGLRAQKKILGRFASSNTGRSLLIDDATSSLLDNIYKMMERAVKSSSALDKKQPEKVLKNIVKLAIKIGLLHRNQQLGPSDSPNITEMQSALRSVAMVVVSFHELEFSFDKAYLRKALERSRKAVLDLIRPHLTEKSQDRCNQVFDFITHDDFLDSVFRQDPENRAALASLVKEVNKSLEEGQI